jgi:hypothetical protein
MASSQNPGHLPEIGTTARVKIVNLVNLSPHLPTAPLFSSILPTPPVFFCKWKIWLWENIKRVETDGGPKARREFHVSDHTR